jgi:hypothetical protein
MRELARAARDRDERSLSNPVMAARLTHPQRYTAHRMTQPSLCHAHVVELSELGQSRWVAFGAVGQGCDGLFR